VTPSGSFRSRDKPLSLDCPRGRWIAWPEGRRRSSSISSISLRVDEKLQGLTLAENSFSRKGILGIDWDSREVTRKRNKRWISLTRDQATGGGRDATHSSFSNPQHLAFCNSPNLPDALLHKKILGRRQVSKPPVRSMRDFDLFARKREREGGGFSSLLSFRRERFELRSTYRYGVGRSQPSVGCTNEENDRVYDGVQVLIGNETERDARLDAGWDDRWACRSRRKKNLSSLSRDLEDRFRLLTSSSSNPYVSNREGRLREPFLEVKSRTTGKS